MALPISYSLDGKCRRKIRTGGEMMMKRFWFLLIFQVILVSESDFIYPVEARNTLSVSHQTDAYDLTAHLLFIEDTNGTLTFD